jgi:hypothetical protein
MYRKGTAIAKFTKYRVTRYIDENGCVLCANIPNQDGYIRTTGSKGKKLEMLHIKEWEAVNGPKPVDMELNHKCGNRGCCNLEHLELISGSTHASITNIGRVGYKKTSYSKELIADVYERIKYKGEYINQMCLKHDIKRSTLSSIMNKRSRCSITDEVDKKFN